MKTPVCLLVLLLEIVVHTSNAAQTVSSYSASSSMMPSGSMSTALPECVLTSQSSVMTSYSSDHTLSMSMSDGWSQSLSPYVTCTMPMSSSMMTSSSTAMETSSPSMPASTMSMQSSMMSSSSIAMSTSMSSMPASSMSTSMSSMPASSMSMQSSMTSSSSVAMSSSMSSMPQSSASMSTYSSMPSSTISPTPASTVMTSTTAQPESSATASTASTAVAASTAGNTASSSEATSTAVVMTTTTTTTTTTTFTQARTTNKRFQIKAAGTIGDFLANRTMQAAKADVRAQIAAHLSINQSRIEVLEIISGSIIIIFEISPSLSASTPSIAELERTLRNDVFSGNFTLVDSNGNPLTIDTTYFISTDVEDDGHGGRRDLVPIIVGSVIGVLCLAVIFIIIIVVVLKKKKPTKHNSFVSPSASNGRRSQSPYGNGANSTLPAKPGADENGYQQSAENDTAPGTSSRPGSEFHNNQGSNV